MPLFLCGTPIGNLEDITLRALRVLREADVVAAEDTRVTRRLLSHYDIHPPDLVSYREENEARMGPQLVARLEAGAKVVVVTDAGMPGVSDPGSALAARARERSLPVEIIPGPSAALAGLVAAGLGGGRFVFEGFLPRHGRERRERLAAVAADSRPVILFEAPSRVLDTLRDLQPLIGSRPVCISRELTKKFEETVAGSVSELIERFATPRGEFTLVLFPAPPTPAEVSPATLDEFLRRCQADGLRAREASEAAARQLGVSRRDAYQRYLEL